MSDIDYIGPNELVFNTDKEAGIYSGGFSINSIMMKSGLSPILTVNTPLQSGGANQVSDLFKDLVIPNWALTYGMNGGEYNDDSSDSDSDSVMGPDIDDDLHDKLLDLVKEHDIKSGGKKKTRRQRFVKKATTRKKKI
jgi:hypothetical protein